MSSPAVATGGELPSTDRVILRIRAGGPDIIAGLRELFEYRDLLYFLAWRDVKVRYKQTAIGVAWAVLQPLSAMLVFSLFFGRLAKMPSDGIPYPLFALAGLMPWQLFAYALTNASTSLVVNEKIVSKVYFPRILVPTATVLAGLIDAAVALALLVLLMFWYGVTLSVTALMAPLFIVLGICTALGVSYWLSALDVKFRDVRYTLPLLTQLWLFATPVVYPSSLLPEPWRSIYGLNPMAGVVEGLRWALLGAPPPSWTMTLLSVVSVALLLAGGIWYFYKVERNLADVI